MLRFISNDGLRCGSQILDAETGEDLTAKMPVAFGATIKIGEMISAKFEIPLIRCDVTIGQSDWSMYHPDIGELSAIARIELRDGTRIAFSEGGTPTITRPTVHNVGTD